MKNFWKRTNRGLLLAGVAIIGVAGFVITDNLMFKKNKSVIEETLKNYTEAIANASIPSSDLQALSYDEWSEEDKQAYYSSISDVVKDCWTDAYDGNDTYVTLKSDILSDIRSIVDESKFTIANDGFITKYDWNFSSINITKNGPGAARFSVVLDIVTEATGNTPLISIGGLYSAWEEPDSAGTIRTSVQLVIFGEVLQEDGKWKISYISSSSNVQLEGGNYGSSD